MEQYVKGFKGFTPVRMCGLSPLASFYYGVLTCSACPNLVQNKQFLCGVGKGGIPLKKRITYTMTASALLYLKYL